MKDINEKLLHELKSALFCKEAIFENTLADCLFSIKRPLYQGVWRDGELSFEIKRRVLAQSK